MYYPVCTIKPLSSWVINFSMLKVLSSHLSIFICSLFDWFSHIHTFSVCLRSMTYSLKCIHSVSSIFLYSTFAHFSYPWPDQLTLSLISHWLTAALGHTPIVHNQWTVCKLGVQVKCVGEGEREKKSMSSLGLINKFLTFLTIMYPRIIIITAEFDQINEGWSNITEK